MNGVARAPARQWCAADPGPGYVRTGSRISGAPLAHALALHRVRDTVESAYDKAKIAVIGAGLMGHGIAQVFALAGHDVTITDSHKPSLDTAKARIAANLRELGDDERAVERVRPVADLADCVREADYVVEAVLEDMPLKQQLFGEIERHVRPDTILASNTSVMPITQIMQGLRDRDARARHALVESAVPGAAGRGDRHAMDLASRRSTSPWRCTPQPANSRRM